MNKCILVLVCITLLSLPTGFSSVDNNKIISEKEAIKIARNYERPAKIEVKKVEYKDNANQYWVYFSEANNCGEEILKIDKRSGRVNGGKATMCKE